MSVGRKPIPSALHELHGQPGKRKPRIDEPLALGNLFAAPKWFNAEQRDEWGYIVDNAVPGVLTSVDRANLTAFVVAAVLHRRAARELNKSKSLFVSVGQRGAKAQHPALAVINRQALIMIKAAAEMGFTPSSRGRVVKSGGEVEPPNGQPITGKPTAAKGGLESFIAGNPDRIARPH